MRRLGADVRHAATNVIRPPPLSRAAFEGGFRAVAMPRLTEQWATELLGRADFRDLHMKTIP
ncbi:hypothetical protein B1T46_13440 [Mycobacterium kansasii]|nr:hypothetical protein B1T46_13440 [Mycobacterium kansasii]